MSCSALRSPCHAKLFPSRPAMRRANFMILFTLLAWVILQLPHMVMQKRRWGRTKVFISNTIVLRGMLCRRRLRRINMPTHLHVTVSMCLSHVRHLSKVTPRLKMDDLTGTVTPKTSIFFKLTCRRVALDPKTIACVLLTFISNRFRENHAANLRRTTWRRVIMTLISCSDPEIKTWVSSAYCTMMHKLLTTFGRSFTYMLNNIGPKTLPCGTPDVILPVVSSQPRTNCVLPKR